MDERNLAIRAIDRALNDISSKISQHCALIQGEFEFESDYNNIRSSAQAIVDMVDERKQLVNLQLKMLGEHPDKSNAATSDWQPCECSGCRECTEIPF